MTIEEAIMAIKHDLRWKLLKDYRQDVADIAISALEKQIPRKPIEKSPWVYHCPRCDSRTIEDAFIKKFKFCPDCGQALDWGDSDE